MDVVVRTEFDFPIIRHHQKADWLLAESATLPDNRALQEWLLDPNSLTAKLKQHCSNFEVRVIGQQPGTIRSDEARWLGDDEHAAIREVILCCDGKPWVFARSVFPQRALDEQALQLGQLGNNPLGAHLFAQADLERGAIEVAKFSPESPIGQLNQQLGYPAQHLWGRRSCFKAAGQKVLVAEVFIGESIPAKLANEDTPI